MNTLIKIMVRLKLKIIGLSALCGSLTAFAASAGELTVSGGATLTWAKAQPSGSDSPTTLWETLD